MYRLQLSYGLQLNNIRHGYGVYMSEEGYTVPVLQLPECMEYENILQNWAMLLMLNMYQTQCWTWLLYYI